MAEAFPLRGSVFCGECGKPLTAGFSRGKTTTHPYYYCFSKACAVYGKSTPRAKLEGEFETALASLTPSPAMHRVVSKMVRTWWDYRASQLTTRAATLRREAQTLSQKIEQAMDKLLECDSPSLQIRFEAKIKTMETERAVLLEQANATPKVRSFDESLRTAMQFLANPRQLWQTGALKDRHVVLKLAFPKGLIYCRNLGLRTPRTPQLFKLFAGSGGSETELAEREGLRGPSMARGLRPRYARALRPSWPTSRTTVLILLSQPKKNAARGRHSLWRRERDSNPRWVF